MWYPSLSGDLRISIYYSNIRFLLGPLSRRFGGAWSTFVSLYLTSQELTGMLADLDWDCMPIGITLRRLTDAHISKIRRSYLVNTCRDVGCRHLLLFEQLWHHGKYFVPCIRREDGRCRFCLKGIETPEHALLLYTGSNELIPLFLALPLSLTHHRHRWRCIPS